MIIPIALLMAQDFRGVTIEIVEPKGREGRISTMHNTKFEVKISNESKLAFKLMNDSCSWGYEKLSFEFKNETGNNHKVTRHPHPWKQNYPQGDEIAVHGSKTISIDFGDGTWDGVYAGGSGNTAGFTMRAHLKIVALKTRSNVPFWGGDITSKWIKSLR